MKFIQGGGFVEAHHMVDHDAIRKTMVHVGDGAQRVGAGVSRAQIFLERDSPHHRGHHHVAARLDIFSVAHGDRQRLGGDAHPFQRDAVADRMVGRREVGFDVVSERVHAGRGGDFCR